MRVVVLGEAGGPSSHNKLCSPNPGENLQTLSNDVAADKRIAHQNPQHDFFFSFSSFPLRISLFTDDPPIILPSDPL